ncbi:MAG: efflux transporter periplasmic adaptor subunit, partial [Pseudomonadota bacterium]
RVFLEISHDLEIVPDVQLISSALVEVVFDGRAFDSTLQISESSLTREGDVWHVDALALLQRFQPDVLWRIGGDLIVAAPANSAAYDIATVPLASFLTGSEVSPCVG